MKRLGFLLALALAPACAGPRVTLERRPDGVYHLTCNLTLQRCLDEAERACEYQRYAVLRAFDLHDYKGDQTQPTSVRSSEAFIRCGGRGSWGLDNDTLRKEPLCPAPAAAAPIATTACTPGASVACVGPGGCYGGQACLPDGSKLGPCDCGPPATPPP